MLQSLENNPVHQFLQFTKKVEHAYYKGKIEANRKNIEELCNFLHVHLNIQIDPVAAEYILEYIGECINKNIIPKVIFSIDDHLEHLDLLLMRYIILDIIKELPQVYPHILTVAAKDVWTNPLMRAFSVYYAKNIATFDRDEKQQIVALRRVLRRVKRENCASILNMANQTGRGVKEHNSSPATLAWLSEKNHAHGLVVIVKTDNPSPTLGKVHLEQFLINKGLTEFLIMISQGWQAHHRQECVTFSAGIELPGIFDLRNFQGNKREDFEASFMAKLNEYNQVSTPKS